MTAEEIDRLPAGPELDKLILDRVLKWTAATTASPKFSTDIKEAFVLVDAIKHRWPLLLTWRPEPCDWWVVMPDECGHPPGDFKHGNDCYREAFAENIPLAVCRCALKHAMKGKQ